MESLTIMPNFIIMAEVSNRNYMDNLYGILRCYCEVIANVEHIDSYRITPESFWKGMNSVPDVDFIQLLKDNTKMEIPKNVITDLDNFKSKFGIITLIGDDCLKVKNEDILTEIKNNTKLNEMIYEYEDDLIFFEGDINTIQKILQNDLSCPVKFRASKVKSYILDDGLNHCLVKAVSPDRALKLLYGKHNTINEENLRSLMNYKKADITDEVINDFMKYLITNINKHFVCMIQVSDDANRKAVKY